MWGDATYGYVSPRSVWAISALVFCSLTSWVLPIPLVLVPGSPIAFYALRILALGRCRQSRHLAGSPRGNGALRPWRRAGGCLCRPAAPRRRRATPPRKAGVGRLPPRRGVRRVGCLTFPTLGGYRLGVGVFGVAIACRSRVAISSFYFQCPSRCTSRVVSNSLRYCFSSCLLAFKACLGAPRNDWASSRRRFDRWGI